MSPLSSPIASSPRSTTPQLHSDDGGVQLTPRSKIKALLAGLDDSDDETASSKAAKPRSVSVDSRKSPELPVHAPFVEDSSDEDDAIVMPRARLAARLQAGAKTTTRVEDAIQKEDLVPICETSTTERPLGSEEREEDQPESPSKGLGRFLKRKRPTVNERQALERTQSKSDSMDSPSTSHDELPLESSSIEAQNVDASDDEHSIKRNRFNALVEKKRAERLAKEAAEQAKKVAKATAQKKAHQIVDGSDLDSSESDDEAGAQLTQKTRPARKAGKKAMEEMARETQRISRNMQLAHEAKTKKKITKESLLARFRPAQKAIVPATSSTVNSSAMNSDAEHISGRQTPLTSPEQPQAKSKELPLLIPETSNLQENSDDEVPILQNILAQSANKGKGRATDVNYEDSYPESHPFRPMYEETTLSLEVPQELPITQKELKQRPIRLIPPKNTVKPQNFEDEDDELEVVHSKVLSLFDNLPTKKNIERRSAIIQRALAQVGPATKASSKDKPAMNSQELGWSLMRKARQQAAAERTERIQDLERKGVIVRSAEEVQKDQIEVEDLLAKAREEEAELTKREKEADKKERRAKGEEVEESSDDEDYQENAEEDDADVELSGSEDGSADESEEESATRGLDDLVDDAAEEDEDEEEEEDAASDEEHQDDHLSENEQDIVMVPRQQRRKANRILESEDEDVIQEPKSKEIQSEIQFDSPGVVKNPFGPQAVSDSAPMGLTQAFAATMADSQLSQEFNQESCPSQLMSMPIPDFADAVPESLPLGTQQQASLQALDFDLHLTQTQIEPNTLASNGISDLTQLSEMPDPTQDVGFQNYSPVLTRFAAIPESTIDTVILPSESPAPINKQRGRLVQKQQNTLAAFSDEEYESEQDVVDENVAQEVSETAFHVMKKAARKAKRQERKFDKGKSEAKEMFEEQAQESEDEYAGLGGASDDSEGEEDEEIRKMIDEGEVNVNERKIAAYHAGKARDENEAAISKLYKDIHSGALRRKRGAGVDFDDLDDSDDDHAARQARKRSEFARMRKALLDGDSNIVKIAEDPKKSAFLRAIEDRDDQEDDLGLLDSTPREEDENEEEAQSQEIIPDSQAENRPPGVSRRSGQGTALQTKISANPRRTFLGPARKPMTLAEVRASVSFLTDEPNSIFDKKVGPSIFDASSDIELEDDGPAIPDDAIGAPDESQPKRNPRRTGPRTDIPKFVDRLSLKRQESSKDSQSSGGHLAFMDPKLSLQRPVFQPPTLLRKATSSFSTFSGQDEHGISANNNAKKTSMEPDVKGRGVIGGSKRSSVNWIARDAERKAALEKRLSKNGNGGVVASMKRQGSGLSNLLAKGSAWE